MGGIGVGDGAGMGGNGLWGGAVMGGNSVGHGAGMGGNGLSGGAVMGEMEWGMVREWVEMVCGVAQ